MIACLGWGSLVWDPRELPVLRGWFEDGPMLPVEFTRKSNDGRMTLVVDPAARSIRVLWAQLQPTDLNAARLALKEREGISAKQWERLIPVWQTGEIAPGALPGLPSWAEAVGVDSVIWTGLAPKFGKEGHRPSIADVVRHLDGLRGMPREHAESYVRNAPAQIDTEYRREIEARLGWTPSGR